MRIFTITKDSETIVDVVNEKIIYFGYHDFFDKIVKANNCFICGASPEDKEFNDEHIIPDWILRKFNLYNNSITLPNQTSINYRNYTIPCCKDCNSLLGKTYEGPISSLLNGSYQNLIEKIAANNSIVELLFFWMCLIYVKTHLKDTLLLQSRDTRIKQGMIGDHFDWSDTHHVHCMARAFYTNTKVLDNVYGSILILPAMVSEDVGKFDYMDHAIAKTAMIQMGEICIIAVLNDSCACQSVFGGPLSKISGPLTPFQIREIFAHMMFINLHLVDRPSYHSTIESGGYEIVATLPGKLRLAQEKDWVVPLPELLYQYLAPLFPDDDPNKNKILEMVRAGKMRYLLNENEEFVDFSKKTK